MIDAHVPVKNLSKKQLKSLGKPWITKCIKNSIKTRDNLLKKLQRENNCDRRSVLYNHYKLFRNRIVDLIRQSKTNYYRQYFNDNLKNSKKIWTGINEIISLKSKKNVTNISLEVGGHLTSN